MFALVNTKGLSNFNFKQYENLKFSVVHIEEVITDTVINRDIYGSILLCNFEPYVFEEKRRVIPDVQHVCRLQYHPLFNPYVLKCLQKVNLAENLEDTIQNDEVLFMYQRDHSILAEFRKFYIESFYSDEMNKSSLYKLIEGEVNTQNYSIYRALIELISSDRVLKESEI